MDNSFHYQLMLVHALFRARVMEHLADAGLSPGQPKILDYLRRHDGSMQKEIAYACQIEPATMTGLLRRMEEKGLLTRQIRPENRRTCYISLTARGREKCKRVEQTFLALEESVFTGISAQERTQFQNTLTKICANMTDIRGLQ